METAVLFFCKECSRLILKSVTQLNKPLTVNFLGKAAINNLVYQRVTKRKKVFGMIE